VVGMSKIDPMKTWLLNIRSPTTREQYVARFKRFLKFTKSTPEKLIAMAEEKGGLRQVDSLTKMFWEDLIQKGYTKNSANTIMQAARSFFSYDVGRLPRVPSGFTTEDPAFEQRNEFWSAYPYVWQNVSFNARRSSVLRWIGILWLCRFGE